VKKSDDAEQPDDVNQSDDGQDQQGVSSSAMSRAVSEGFALAAKSGESGDAVLATITTREGISISLIREPSDQATGVVTVSLPKGVATSGNGFSFPLPERVAAAALNNRVRVTTASGGMLPSWLRYIAKTRGFVAASVPGGAFPMQVLINIGTQQTTLVISERTSQ